MTLKIPFETLTPGPSGKYISVVDVDEHGQLVNPPLDLDRSDLLAQNGLPVSDGNPAFRQQMVYAVLMRTIAISSARLDVRCTGRLFQLATAARWSTGARFRSARTT
jgi:hypothetical protein